jgi:predicted DNA-binding ribbon-helix-helix protein
MKSGLIKRSFWLAGRRTSVALEQEFWAALMRFAERSEPRQRQLAGFTQNPSGVERQ